MSAERRTAVLVFARAPVPGAAKTRLMPLLGAAGAACLQRRLTEQALDVAVRADVGPVELWCTPDPVHPFFARCAQARPIALQSQSGATLGARMANAVQSALARYRAVVIMGTDCPALTPEHLRAAASAMTRRDAVVYPAEDGGYVLLGMRRPCPEAFEDVDWGSSRVFAQTMARFERAQQCIVVGETLWDVDRPADFARLARLQPRWADLADGNV